jgi:hypothetical protein
MLLSEFIVFFSQDPTTTMKLTYIPSHQKRTIMNLGQMESMQNTMAIILVKTDITTLVKTDITLVIVDIIQVKMIIMSGKMNIIQTKMDILIYH